MRHLLPLLLAALPAAAAAGEAATIETAHVSAEIVVRNAATAPGERVDIAVRHDLADGWHTYWENPGDSGEPPIAQWRLPAGTEPAPLRFPAPKRIPYPPLMNYGFDGEFTLLSSVTVPPDWPAGRPYPVTLAMDWVVCADICIPEGGKASFVIPTAEASAPDSGVAFAFLSAEWALPKDGEPGSYRRAADRSLTLALPGAGTDAYFFSAVRDATDTAAPQVAAAIPGGIELAVPAGGAALDGTLDGVVVDGTGARRVVLSGPADPPAPVAASAAAPAAAPAPAAPPAFWRTVGLALLGGLILNLMPCVFPVLALKALGLVAHADAPFGRRAGIGAAYAAGILAAFGAVAGVLFAVKEAGGDALWGFQLQDPGFVAAMATLLFLVGLNLSGVFEVGAAATRLGAHDRGGGAGGAFASGVLATLVATPCTAPFMAVALGAALVAPPATAAATFAALGLGLALPFVLLSLMPGLSRILPRPGAWMLRLRQALAFPLYLTAAWLVWVLAQLVGAERILPALVALVLAAMAAWLFGLSQRGAGRGGTVAGFLAAIVLGVALAALWPVASAPPAARAVTTDAYTPERLAALTAAGRPVFVNVTAAWCITCKVNERVVLSTDAFADVLAAHDAAYLTADWTRRDPDVTRFIERFGRAGVPLYVLFDASGTPTVLPQILSADTVRAVFAP